MHAVRILIIDREVIVDVAIHRVGPHLAAAQTDRAQGMRAGGPIDHIQIVDVLLDDVIAA